jgi:hypothetical protein
LDVAKLRATKGGWRKQLLKDKSPMVQKHTICTGCNATLGRDIKHFKRHIITDYKITEGREFQACSMDRR